MPFQDIADLARTIATADVQDHVQLHQILHQLQEVWRLQSEEGSTAEIDGYFEIAIELAQVLAQNRPLTVEEVLTLITRLVARTECAVARAGIRSEPRGVVLKIADHHQDTDLSLSMTQGGPTLNDMALGALLVQLGTITESQIAQAADLQRKTGMRIGDAVVHLGFADNDQIREVADLQHHLRDHARTWKDHRTTPLKAGETPDTAEVCGSLLGEILVRTKAITRAQLDEGLKVRRASGLRLGEALVQVGACSWTSIRRAVRTQESMRQQLGVTSPQPPADEGGLKLVAPPDRPLPR